MLVLNGEIYNYLELRRILKNKKHSFISNSDTEVLSKSICAEWGLNCLDKLNGMFAFAIYDFKKKKLCFLQEIDHRKKPFYYKK